ncbi:hypothetical protein EYF80_063222 [Liparis tanakae]|uniref:Uncharacterized protein n=1 Tax=Liparis tanakae TaxID=230148 RepID=A0A4Z2EED1_9TELE|nr:hypothetical protein EYF80_063222 [Liparis tanakae]
MKGYFPNGKLLDPNVPVLVLCVLCKATAPTTQGLLAASWGPREPNTSLWSRDQQQMFKERTLD